MDNRETLFLQEVSEELARARAKFPSSKCSLAALTEEVGEVAKAMLDESEERVYEEAVQVAVMAMRVALDGDVSMASYRSRPGGPDDF